MVKSFFWGAALIASAVLLFGCSDTESVDLTAPPTLNPPATADVEGIWVGRGSMTGGTQAPGGGRFNIVLTLSQVGSEITGTVMHADGKEGDVTGTLNGQIVSFTLTQGKPCVGSYSGAATVSTGDTELTGSYSGSDCDGTLSADFTVSMKGSK